MSAPAKPIFVVVGIGNGQGTGAAAAREFSNAGYIVALVARREQILSTLAEELNGAGGDAHGFPVSSYDHAGMRATFAAIRARWPASPLRVALWNTADGTWKPFLEVTEADLHRSIEANVVGAFAFSREAILAFQEQELDAVGKRGALIFTSATAAWRGNKTTSTLSAGKFAQRALTQSLAKEFGPQNIHVSTVIIDGMIHTDFLPSRPNYEVMRKHPAVRDNFEEWSKNVDIRLSPESIAKSYMYLANQDRSAWTWELDLRPAHEPW